MPRAAKHSAAAMPRAAKHSATLIKPTQLPKPVQLPSQKTNASRPMLNLVGQPAAPPPPPKTAQPKAWEPGNLASLGQHASRSDEKPSTAAAAGQGDVLHGAASGPPDGSSPPWRNFFASAMQSGAFMGAMRAQSTPSPETVCRPCSDPHANSESGTQNPTSELTSRPDLQPETRLARTLGPDMNSELDDDDMSASDGHNNMQATNLVQQLGDGLLRWQMEAAAEAAGHDALAHRLLGHWQPSSSTLGGYSEQENKHTAAQAECHVSAEVCGWGVVRFARRSACWVVFRSLHCAALFWVSGPGDSFTAPCKPTFPYRLMWLCGPAHGFLDLG